MSSAMHRFNDKWEAITETGCWLWNATPKSVYGLFWLDGKNEHAHRASWMLNVGPIPTGGWVLHTCDVAGCVNPDHLYIGDHTTNTADAVRRGRMSSGAKHRVTHKASRRTANDGSGILNDEFCLTIKILATKSNKVELADTYNVHLTTIYRAISIADALLEALEDK